MHPDQAGLQPAEILRVPDRPLGQDQPAEQPAPPGGPPRRARDGQAEDEREGQPGQQPADVRVELGDPHKGQAEAGRRRVAGQRPGAGDHGAGREHQRYHRHQGGADQPQVPADHRGRGTVALAAAHVQHDRGAQDRGREQEVHRHPGRVQPGQHDDAADHGLADHPARQCRREPHQIPPRPAAARRPVPARGDEREPGDGHERDVQQAVAELDPGVQRGLAGRARRHQAVAGAVGPVRAAEAGLAEPHRLAGRDDDRVGDHRRQREAAHRGRRGPPHQPHDPVHGALERRGGASGRSVIGGHTTHRRSPSSASPSHSALSPQNPAPRTPPARVAAEVPLRTPGSRQRCLYVHFPRHRGIGAGRGRGRGRGCGAGGAEAGGDDAADGGPLARRQVLAEDGQADERRHRRLQAHPDGPARPRALTPSGTCARPGRSPRRPRPRARSGRGPGPRRRRPGRRAARWRARRWAAGSGTGAPRPGTW